MKKLLLLLTLFFPLFLSAQNKPDWLIDNSPYKAFVVKSPDGKNIEISNGLLSRTFRITPDAACISYKNIGTNEQFLRAVKPEARIVLDGKSYNIGGLYGQKQQAYLLESSVDSLTAGTHDLQFTGYAIKPVSPYLNWKSSRWKGDAKQLRAKNWYLLFNRKNLLWPELSLRLITVCLMAHRCYPNGFR